MKELIYIEEPNILFGFNQKMDDPRDGLTLFGPIENTLPYGILSGVIGTKDGLDKFKKYVKSIQSPKHNYNDSTRPFFPGFEAVFKTKWDSERVLFKEITDSEIGRLLYHEDTNTRTFNLVSLYTDKIIEADENEDFKANIWFEIISDEIYQYYRPN